MIRREPDRSNFNKEDSSLDTSIYIKNMEAKVMDSKTSHFDDPNLTSTLDQFVLPGIRLWMAIAVVGSIVITLIIFICSKRNIRIPPNIRQDELQKSHRLRSSKREHTGIERVHSKRANRYRSCSTRIDRPRVSDDAGFSTSFDEKKNTMTHAPSRITTV